MRASFQASPNRRHIIVVGASISNGGFGYIRLERIRLDVYDFNPNARRLYERVGFVHEGVLRHATFREGRYVDVHRMAILADEWRAGLPVGEPPGT